MANEYNKMLFILDAQNEKLLTKLDQSEKKLESFKRSSEEKAGAVAGSLAKMFGAFLSFEAITRFTETTIEATREQERLNRQLQQLTGDASKASKQMEQLELLSKKMPVTVDELTESFISLRRKGFDASAEALTGYGNLAAGFGKQLGDVTQAVEAAANGQTRALKDFGIAVVNEGENLKVTFQGVTTSIKNNGVDIQRYLQDLGNTKFAGAMDAEMNTLDGQFKKLADNVDQLFEQSAESTKPLKDALAELNRTISDPQFKAAFDSLAAAAINAFSRMISAASKLVDVMHFIGEEIAASLGGPAIGDIARIDSELGAAQSKLTQMYAARIKAEQDGGLFSGIELRNLEKQIPLQEQKVKQLQSMLDITKKGIEADQRASRAPTSNDFSALSGKVTGAPVGAGEDSQSAKAEKEAEKLAQIGAKNLERVMDQLATETEAINKAYAEREDIILANTEKGSELQFELLTRNNQAREAELKRSEDRMTAIQNKALSDRQRFEKMSRYEQTKFVFQNLQQLTAGVAQHSRAMFNINKASGIANAIINTAEGVTKALSAYPPPLSFAMAAAQAAAGFAQISAIKSASFEGGGNGTTPSMAGSASTVNSIPAGSNTADVGQISKQQRSINITFTGGITDPQAIRNFLTGPLQEAIDDGVKINAVVM